MTWMGTLMNRIIINRRERKNFPSEFWAIELNDLLHRGRSKNHALDLFHKESYARGITVRKVLVSSADRNIISGSKSNSETKFEEISMGALENRAQNHFSFWIQSYTVLRKKSVSFFPAHMHTETHKDTEIHRETNTHRDTHRHPDTYTHKHTHRDTDTRTDTH